MKTPLNLLIIVLLFTSCNGQKSNNDKIKIPKVYTDKDIVTSSIIDKDGNLWFGTTSEGLYKYDGETFTNFNENNGLCTDQIWSIIEDNKGIIWLGTNQGLCKYENNKFDQIPLPYIDVSSDWYKDIYPTVNPNQVISMIQDSNGTYWIGTSGGGAYKYDGKQFESILADQGRKYQDSLHHNVIQSILEDRNGKIWFASMSNGGITSYDGKSFQVFKNEDGLSDNMVRYLYQDSKKNIWIGTNGNRNGGLDKLKDSVFTNFNQTDGLCSNNVTVIFQSKDGKIWLGSDREALCYYENEVFKSFDKLSGISIRTIIEEGNGSIWFGGRKGSLLKYNGEKLIDYTHLKNK